MKTLRRAMTLLGAVAVAFATIASPATAATRHHGHAYGHFKPGHKGAPPPVHLTPPPPNLPSYCPRVPLEVLLRMTLPGHLLIECSSYYAPVREPWQRVSA